MKDQLIELLKVYFDNSLPDFQYLEEKVFFEKKAKKEYIVKADTHSRDFYFILNGYVRTYYLAAKGEEITTDILGRGEMTASIYSLLKGEPAYENIQCVTDCLVCRISEKKFEELALQDARWYMLSMKFLKAALLKKEERIIDFARLKAHERYVNLLTQRPDILQNVPVQYIASYLGIQPESLSRIRNQSAFS